MRRHGDTAATKSLDVHVILQKLSLEVNPSAKRTIMLTTTHMGLTGLGLRVITGLSVWKFRDVRLSEDPGCPPYNYVHTTWDQEKWTAILRNGIVTAVVQRSRLWF